MMIGFQIQMFRIRWDFCICPFDWRVARRDFAGRRWWAFGPFRVVYLDYAAMESVNRIDDKVN